MSGVVGRSHCTSTLGGTGLASLGLRGGPGQAVGERVKDMHCTHSHWLLEVCMTYHKLVTYCTYQLYYY